MADFIVDLPDDLIKEFEKFDKDVPTMMKKMTRAGAKTVKQAVIANLPSSLKSSNFAKNIKISKDYKTPSDGAYNTKVYISGYFTNEKGQTVPAPLIANIFEHGRSNAPFPKQPFFRKSFKSKDIEKAMLNIQKEYIDE